MRRHSGKKTGSLNQSSKKSDFSRTHHLIDQRDTNRERDSSQSASSQISAHPRPRVFHTELGWIGFGGSEKGVTILTFGHENEEDVYDRLCFETLWNQAFESLDVDSDTGRLPELPPHPAWMDFAEEQLTAYAAGEPVDLSQIPCDLAPGTRFEQRVREQLAKVGYGQMISYGELAEAAGAPRAARAVGSVMARNPIPLIIPCHRVVAAAGKLGGYSAAAGLSMKERLLNLEQSGVSHAFARP